MSNLLKRYLTTQILEDLENRKMVFIGGPRQVGKTILSQSFLKNKQSDLKSAYLNWDHAPTRSMILNNQLPVNQPLIIFDEIHKFVRWRNLIKGIYDIHKDILQIIVTGSARLDYYRKGGDSLLGRYHYFRLHPFSINEYPGQWQDLLEYSGFPEPLLKKDANYYRRWSLSRIEKIIHEDITSLENIKEISLIDLLVEALPARVGSPLSIKSLKENLELAHETVERYIQILERLYLVYRILPYGSEKIKAVKKEQKLYFWDWCMNTNPGAKFENFVASHLLKYCHYIEDTQGYKMELRFVRDFEKREIDFIVIKNKKIEFAVECKTGESAISNSAYYLKNKLKITKFYQVHLGTKSYLDAKSGIQLMPFKDFCRVENIP